MVWIGDHRAVSHVSEGGRGSGGGREVGGGGGREGGRNEVFRRLSFLTDDRFRREPDNHRDESSRGGDSYSVADSYSRDSRESGYSVHGRGYGERGRPMNDYNDDSTGGALGAYIDS